MAYKTKTIFGDTKFAFTPVVIEAKRELYVAAARRALELYADMFVEKMRLIRGGAKTSDNQASEKPKDNTTLEDVTKKAKENNEATAVTTKEMTIAAEDAIKAGKYQLAADYYAKLEQSNPTDANFAVKHSAMYLNYLNKPKEAIKVLDDAAKRFPNEPAIFYNRGTSYVKTEDWKKARKDFDQAIALRADLPEYYLNRGIVFIYLKDLDAALADFNRGLQLAPRLANLYRARAVVYRAKGNTALAQGPMK